MGGTKDYPYLYRASASEARRNDELEEWRESHRENISCKRAIEEAVRTGFDGMHLDDNCVQKVIEQYGFKRVGWVLSNTIQQQYFDGRFSYANKTWSQWTFIPLDEHNVDFVVESHPAVLDGFIKEFRKAYGELRMFNHSHCESTTGQELKGKVLVVSPYELKEAYWTPKNQLWLATGGFGCSIIAPTRAVYAVSLGDGEQTEWNREDFIGVLKEEYLPDWAMEKLQEYQAQTETPAQTEQSM